MRKKTFLIIIIIAALGAVLGTIYWPKIQESMQEASRPSPQEENLDLEKVEALLESENASDALEIIRKYDAYITPTTPKGKRWLEYLIAASEKLPNPRQLTILYEYFPDMFNDREDAALLISQNYLNEKRINDFERFRSRWKGRETEVDRWFLIDGDKLVLEGEKDKAIDHLRSQPLRMTNDSRRLMRLSILVAEENPREAWVYLREAMEKDPSNPSVRVYRSKLLEASDKQSLALSELVSAVQLDSKNTMLRDQLGEFFLRYHYYPQAVEVWSTLIKENNENTPDWIILKAWFWGHMAKPTGLDWKHEPIKDGRMKPFIEYLTGLKKGTYWNEASFEQIPNSNRYLRTQQATFWLRLAQHLKMGREKEALELIRFNKFKERSWSPELEIALERILNYRIHGSLAVETDISLFPYYNVEFNPYAPFFKKLETHANDSQSPLPQDTKTLILSEDAFSATFLAAGWYQLALELRANDKVVPKNYPAWYSYGFTQAIRENQGDDVAMQFASRQHPTKQIDLITSELLIATGNPEAALEKLKSIADQNTFAGKKALWLESLLYIQQKQTPKAKDLINANPAFAKSIVGQELLARIAIIEGDAAKAEEIYALIEQDSPEAKSYFARQAFSNKNWTRARRLTEELLAQYPNNVTIRKNLQKIIESEKAE